MGDKLPTLYDTTLHIYHLSQAIGTDKRKATITLYARALHRLWVQSFGEEHVIPLFHVCRILSRIMSEYVSFRVRNLYGDVRRKVPPKNLRRLHKEWLNYCEEHACELCEIEESKGRPKKKSKSIVPDRSSSTNTGQNGCGLLDIGMDTSKLAGAERVFYHDQNGERKFRVSTEIDQDYVREQERKIELALASKHEDSINDNFANPDEFHEIVSPSTSASTISASVTPARSERYLKRSLRETASNEAIEQHQVNHNTRRELRSTRNFVQDAKDAIATISYRCAISVENTRTAFQVVCQLWYGHRYYLTPDEQQQFEQPTENLTTSKKPRSADEYARYKYVIPSARVVGDFKHNKALQKEVFAAKKLGNIEKGSKVTLHYDTTRRSRIDDEWPSLILNILNDDPKLCHMIALRALFFAFEDREQIVRLFVETLKRLSVASGGLYSAKQLWENVTNIMTDAFTKNLKIECRIAEVLESKHIPYHTLCKSHTCEKLDEACIKTLITVKNELKYADLIIRKQPQLKVICSTI